MRTKTVSTVLTGVAILLVSISVFAGLDFEDEIGTRDVDQRIQDLIIRAEDLAFSGTIKEAKGVASQALAIARDTENSALLNEAIYTMATIFELEGNYLTARQLFQEALPYYRQGGDRELLAEVLSALGGCNGHLSDNDRAVENYEEALRIYEELENAEGIIYTLNNIAVIYNNIGNIEMELEYYNKALRRARLEGLAIGECLALANIGATHADKKEYEQARDHLLPALELAEAEADDSLTIYILTELATIDLEEEQPGLAEERTRRALELSRANGYGKDEYAALLLLAEIEAAGGNFNTAFQMANQCDELIHKLNLVVEKHDTTLLRAKIYAAQGDYQNAYKLLQEYRQIEISQRKKENREAIHELQAQFDSERKENEIALLNQEKRVMNLELAGQRNLQIFLIVGLSLSLILIGLAVHYSRTKARANREIEEKNKALSSAYQAMEKQAKTDHLTGLINRRAFYELLNYEQRRQNRSAAVHSFILADIDHFKQINDTRGHEVGDQVLFWTANLMHSMIRDQDVLGRWGGEEFLFFLPDTNAEGASALAEKIRLTLEDRAYAANGDSLRVSLTFGIAEWHPGEMARDVIHLADEALYFGKSRGRNCVQLYKPGQSRLQS